MNIVLSHVPAHRLLHSLHILKPSRVKHVLSIIFMNPQDLLGLGRRRSTNKRDCEIVTYMHYIILCERRRASRDRFGKSVIHCTLKGQ